LVSSDFEAVHPIQSTATMSELAYRPVNSKFPISAEARGLARDFCQRVSREAKSINEQTIGAPLRRRMARHPDRRPRDGLLRDLERGWREAKPQQFRLEFRSSWRGRDVFMMERAVTMVDAFRLAHWDANDYGVAVMDTWFEVSRGQAKAGVRTRMWIGSHALARWYQRSSTRSDGQLLHDIGLGAGIDTDDRAAFPDLDDVRVPVNVAEGWRGALMLAPEEDGDDLGFYAKTFV
jgi:hypothetical protein